MTTIYTLKDPTTEEIRYVGKTDQSLTKRLSQHIGSKADHYVNRWIRYLMAQSQRPIIESLEETTPDLWKERERFYIADLRQRGYKLTNCNDGGDGVGTDSIETRRKKSLSWQGKTNNPGLGGWNKGQHKFDVEKAKSLWVLGFTYIAISEYFGNISANGVRHALGLGESTNHLDDVTTTQNRYVRYRARKKLLEAGEPIPAELALRSPGAKKKPRVS